jgi:peptidylprolyl isomerase/peptidyl-prolyl cis-trans isomerase D
MSVKSASERVKPILLNEKKSALLIKKLEKGSLEEIAAAQKIIVQELNETSWTEPASVLYGDKSPLGAMLSIKENSLVRDVVGKNGVYGVQLIKRISPLKLNSYEPTRFQMNKTMRKDGNTIYGAMREAANIGELIL